MRLEEVHDSPKEHMAGRGRAGFELGQTGGCDPGLYSCRDGGPGPDCAKAPCAGGGNAQAKQAYLTHFQASIRDYPGEITMFLEDFGDTQVGESLL